MTFQKGNTLWKKGWDVKLERQQKVDQFFLIAGSGGMERYGELLEDLSNGVDLTKEEKEYMDRFEKLFQYMKAKKTDVTSGDKPIEGVLVKFVDNADD